MWSSFEKAAYMIFSTFRRLDFLFFGNNPTSVHTDHRNILFVFTPITLEQSGLGNYVVSKVQRWALLMSRFDYNLEHVNG